MLNFRVKEELTKEDEKILRDNGFILHTGTPYKRFKNENFEIILNPCLKNGEGKCIVNFDGNSIIDGFGESFNPFEIWETINMLIANEIIFIEKVSE